MTGTEIIGLVASLVSLVIAGFAIWLSVTFYKLSTKNAKDLEKASSKIDLTVNRLEVLFDKLYSDTFSMMKDTVTDMRKHVWKNTDDIGDREPTEIEKSFDELKSELNEKIEDLISSQGAANEKVNSFAKKIEDVVNETIDKTARETSEKSWEEKEKLVLSVVKSYKGITNTELIRATGLTDDEVTDLIFTLGNEEKLVWKGGPNGFSSDTLFRVGPKG